MLLQKSEVAEARRHSANALKLGRYCSKANAFEIAGFCPIWENDMQRILISIQQTCTILGVGRTTVNKLRNQGLIKTTKIGSRRLVYFGSVLDYIGPGLAKSDL